MYDCDHFFNVKLRRGYIKQVYPAFLTGPWLQNGIQSFLYEISERLHK